MNSERAVRSPQQLFRNPKRVFWNSASANPKRLKQVSSKSNKAFSFGKKFFFRQKPTGWGENDTIPVIYNVTYGPYTHILVYTKSSLTEQSSPSALGAKDESAYVSEVNYIGKDLDPGELGGSIRWLPPPKTDLVQEYDPWPNKTGKQNEMKRNCEF